MIHRLVDTFKVEAIFDGWAETLIYSCVQRVMGKVLVTDLVSPKSAVAYVGCFAFLAGEPCVELVLGKPEGFVIMVPQNEEWARLIESCHPDSKRVTRYAFKKDTHFDRMRLEHFLSTLPSGYELAPMDSRLYDMCKADPALSDLVLAFDSKSRYLDLGRGMVVLKEGKIVSGASSYTRYCEGIEIEVDTLPAYRTEGLATVVCAALILRCLDEGLYPSWDAQNLISVHLAEKLGYEFDGEYFAYEI